MASLDFASAPPPAQHSLYPQPSDLDGANFNLPHSETSDQLDTPDTHQNYDLFPNQQQHFSSQRYRTNASSSSSLGHPYAMNSDNGLYSHSGFADSVPSFGSSNSNPYDMINTYSSGKVSPLTPSDPVGGLHHGPFPPSVPSKDFSPSTYQDMGDRRHRGREDVGGGGGDGDGDGDGDGNGNVDEEEQERERGWIQRGRAGTFVAQVAIPHSADLKEIGISAGAVTESAVHGDGVGVGVWRRRSGPVYD